MFICMVLQVTLISLISSLCIYVINNNNNNHSLRLVDRRAKIGISVATTGPTSNLNRISYAITSRFLAVIEFLVDEKFNGFIVDNGHVNWSIIQLQHRQSTRSYDG